MRLRNFLLNMLKPNHWHTAFSIFIRGSLIIAMLGALFNQRYTVLFVSSLALLLTFVPAMIERNSRISVPAEWEFTIVLFIYTSLYLGELHEYYTKFWWWDVILHASSSLVLGFIGFLILFALYEGGKIKAKPITIAVFTFCFAVALGAIWEIFEFGLDYFFTAGMQASGLVDTMWDLIVDTLGGLIVAFLGFWYMKGGKTRIFETMVKRFAKENPKLFEE